MQRGRQHKLRREAAAGKGHKDCRHNAAALHNANYVEVHAVIEFLSKSHPYQKLLLKPEFFCTETVTAQNMAGDTTVGFFHAVQGVLHV